MRRLALIAFLVTTHATTAHAFCRSTTCKGECPTDDAGCPSTGLPLSWKGSCVGLAFQQGYTRKLPKADVKAAIERSMFAWTGVACSAGGRATIAFSEAGEVACKLTKYDDGGPNVNVVLFQDDDFPYRGIDNTLAKTTVTFDATTGEILDADIEVNAAFNEVTIGDQKVAFDLESIMTHELGHLLGLAHSDDANATMNPAYEQGSVDFRSLDKDDVAGICAVYPPARVATCDPLPRGGLATTCSEAAPDGSSGGCQTGTGAPTSPAPFVVALLGCCAWARRRAWCTGRR